MPTDFVLLLAVICFAFLESSSVTQEQSGYRWSIEVLHLTKDFELVYGGISTGNSPVPSSTESDIPSYPQDRANQAAELYHHATSHVLKVQTVDSTGVVSGVVMRSLVNSGNIPRAKLSYPTPVQETDWGKNLIKIHGLLHDFGGHDSSGLSLMYPVPIHTKITFFEFELPTVSLGSVLLQSVSKTFHVADLTENPAPDNLRPPVVQRRDWLPEMLARKQFMSWSLTDDIFLTSLDEFESFSAHKVESRKHGYVKCPHVLDATVPLAKRVLHLRKAGPAISKPSTSSNAKWDLSNNSLTFSANVDSCLVKASLSPTSYTAQLLLLSTTETVYFSEELEESKLRLKKVRTTDGISACAAASLTKNSCVVIDHAFEPSSCCKIYVLLQNLTDYSYVLMEHPGVSTKAKWKKLAMISSILPSLNHHVDQVVFLDEDDHYTGTPFRIHGISTLNYPDGVLYLWGDVLLIYDIRSGILAWIPAFLPDNGLMETDNAIQFISANDKGIYSILTKSGSVWMGAASPFEKHYSHLLTLVMQSPPSNYLAIFFDSSDTLYGLKYRTKGSNYTIEREQIKIAESDSSRECSRIRDCTRLSLSCGADSSAFHINHTAFSRTRHFSVRPPVIMPRQEIFANVSYCDGEVFQRTGLLFCTMVVHACSLVTSSSQKIGEANWWLMDGSNSNADQLQNWWFTTDKKLEDYREYLAVSNLLPNDPILYLSKKQYQHETIRPGGKYEFWDTSYCALPSVIYLDKNKEFRFNVSLEHSLSSTTIDFENLRLVAISSDNTALDVTTVRHSESFDIFYEVIITGHEKPHAPPGELLSTVSVAFYPWNPPSNPPSKTGCCSHISKGTAFEQNMFVKVGCPPGRRLRFDTQRSLDILFSRGRTDDFECLYDARDNIPCFTTSEFAAAFSVEDLVTGERYPFEGNYTLEVVSGGVGYLENFKQYNEEEVKSYNYRPGDSKTLLSLIWSVLLESSSEGMRDERTGKLIFDAKNPASIVFECRLNSPCGNIPLGTSNPGEFYLEIEVSNKGVDSSTNCDYTMRFMIHLIGIELSPRVHLMLMLVTLLIIFMLFLAYYACRFHDGYLMMKRFLKKEDNGLGGDSESEFAVPPPQFRELTNRRLTLGGIQNHNLPAGGLRRPSLLVQSLIHDAERGKKRSSLRVHGALNTRSNTSSAGL